MRYSEFKEVCQSGDMRVTVQPEFRKQTHMLYCRLSTNTAMSTPYFRYMSAKLAVEEI
jgi:hypothetical protein